jgi:hypothetical protein
MDHQKLTQTNQLRGGKPLRQDFEIIGSNDKMQGRAGVCSSHVSHRIDRIGDSSPLKFPGGNIERGIQRFCFNREPGHDNPVFTRNHAFAGFMGWNGTGNEKNTIQARLFPGITGNQEMPLVWRVKSSAEQTQLHDLIALPAPLAFPDLNFAEVFDEHSFERLEVKRFGHPGIAGALQKIKCLGGIGVARDEDEVPGKLGLYLLDGLEKAPSIHARHL